MVLPAIPLANCRLEAVMRTRVLVVLFLAVFASVSCSGGSPSIPPIIGPSPMPSPTLPDAPFWIVEPESGFNVVGDLTMMMDSDFPNPYRAFVAFVLVRDDGFKYEYSCWGYREQERVFSKGSKIVVYDAHLRPFEGKRMGVEFTLILATSTEVGERMWSAPAKCDAKATVEGVVTRSYYFDRGWLVD